jgi:hypothetical protein
MTIHAHAIASVKAAFRAHLLADTDLAALIGSAIHDAPPRDAPPPYLVLGNGGARDNGSVGYNDVIVDLELVVVTRERGSADALIIASGIEAASRTLPDTLGDFHLVALEWRQTLTRHDAATSITRAILRLGAFVEPL